jgi:hypothetical protein
MNRRLTVAVTATITLTLAPPPARALPTMIRLGYIDCASCHLSPQGGGPLNQYGRGIDEGQSLRAGEYRPRDNRIVRALSLNGRVAQDFRLVLPMQRAWPAHESSDSFRPRLLYRNVTELPRGFAAHLSIAGETDAVPPPDISYDPGPQSSSPIVSVAMLRYRATPGIEVYAGRDQLPIGLNVPDLNAFIKQRNSLGFYDAPAQVKVHWAGKRHRIVPFVFAGGGNEPGGDKESGVGTLAEIDPFGSHRVVVGVNLLRGGATLGSRNLVGVHARLGFGSWGILAEHDVTSRVREPLPASFRQQASYGQVFWAAREWLVASATVERLTVQQPFEERLNGGRIDLAARLTSVATVSAGMGAQRNMLSHRVSRTFVVQIALKTVY